MLSDPQIERYSRQIILPQLGGKGQEQLLRAKVLVSGDGPLQIQALLYLAAAGIGRIDIHGTAYSPIWTALVPESRSSAGVALQRLNPDCTAGILSQKTLSECADLVHLIQKYDVVIAEPNAQLHAACYVACRPFICGQVLTTVAWLATYRGYEEHLPCFSCEALPFAETPSSCTAEELAASFVGTMLATEAIKLILGLNQKGPTKLLQYRFSELSFHDRILVKNPHCSLCQQG